MPYIEEEMGSSLIHIVDVMMMYKIMHDHHYITYDSIHFIYDYDFSYELINFFFDFIKKICSIDDIRIIEDDELEELYELDETMLISSIRFNFLETLEDYLKNYYDYKTYSRYQNILSNLILSFGDDNNYSIFCMDPLSAYNENFDDYSYGIFIDVVPIFSYSLKRFIDAYRELREFYYEIMGEYPVKKVITA